MRRFSTALLLLIASAAFADDAAIYFRQNCTSCHTIGGGRLVGPDLKNVTQRRDRLWLQSFIANPKAKFDASDPYVLQLKEEARGAVMPNISGINEGIAASLLALIDAESKLPKSQFIGLNIGDQPFTAADIQNGYRIFTGQRKLANGGPACVSCHTVQGIGGLGGGQLGPDLTKVYERLQGRKGLAAWLQAPATPTMRPTFANTAITNDEIVPLVAYFESAARQRPAAQDTSLLTFFIFGIGGSVLGFAGVDFIWRKRFRGVRRPLTRGGK
jgi:mono/diheme cytochrome c family protein